jgi:hypothetical protein
MIIRSEWELGVELTAKSFMSAKKITHLTTLSMDEPAAARTALRFSMHWAVF